MVASNGESSTQQDHPGGTFQDGVAAVLMGTEELRQVVLANGKCQSRDCLHVRHRMEELVGILFSLHPNEDVEKDLKRNCHTRLADAALDAIRFVTSKSEKPEKDNPEMERDIQGAVARITELTLILHDKDKEVQKDIIATYTAYQRKVIRQRVTPSITKLVAQRQWKEKHGESWMQQVEVEDDEDEEDGNASLERPTHSNVMTTILSQASSLVHPLIIWKSQLPPQNEVSTPIHQLCQDAVTIVDEQAQNLIKTVASWFIEDKLVDETWMGKSADETPCNTEEISQLDNLVDEMAFACQIFDRYLGLIASEKQDTSPKVIQELHGEWTWKYASLERYLTSQHMRSALNIAHPVQIVLETAIQVPSVVEDAQFLSTRAMERAASAHSTQAIATVAHAIANNIWSTESPVEGGVYRAIVDQRGCYKEEDEIVTNVTSPPNSSSFASALVGALDEDLAAAPIDQRRSPTRSDPAPSSGGFLGGISSSLASGDKLRQIRIDTSLCALNGAHSASSACTSLVNFLDSLLPESDDDKIDKAWTLIQLAREDLFRYSKEYKLYLESKAKHIVSEHCGTVSDKPVYRGDYFVPILLYRLERENYDIPNAEALKRAEDDVRLNQIFIEPLEGSVLLSKLERCDAHTLYIVCGEVASTLVRIFFESLLSDSTVRSFTDWGALLLSKQVRTIQNHVTKVMEKLSDGAVPMLPQWERLSQLVTALQLEKPSDWSYYQSSSSLLPNELERILTLRKDFSKDVIATVVNSVKQKTQSSTC